MADVGSGNVTPTLAQRRGPVIPHVRIHGVVENGDGGDRDGDITPNLTPQSAAAAVAATPAEDVKRNSAAGRWLLVRSNIHKTLYGYDSTGECATGSATNSPAEGPSDPRSLITHIQSGPSIQSYTRLKRQLQQSDRQWILQFLELKGLELLYGSLTRLCSISSGPGPGRRSPSIANAFAQIECVACFKAVMDSQAGLDYIIEDTEFTRKLANALDTDNAPVKKQVFELLSALCMYSADGYSRAIDALGHYKESKEQHYRFGLIIDELHRAETTAYKTTLVAFINCILIATDSVEDRIRIRNEFVGLKLLDILTNLRKTESDDLDLVVQLDVFDDKKVADEEQFSGPRGVDLNNPIDVFHALFKQVCDTPQSTQFLTILQHLLRIDPKDSLSEVIWEVSEKLIHKSVLLEKKEYADKLLKLGEREIARSVASLRARADSSVASTPRLENGKDILTPRSEHGVLDPTAATTTATTTNTNTTGENSGLTGSSRKMGVMDTSCVSESVQSQTATDGISFSKPSSASISPPSSLAISSPIVPPPAPPPAPFMAGPAPPPPPPPGMPAPPPPPPGPGGIPPPPPPGIPGPPGLPGMPAVPSMPSSSAIPNVKPKSRMRTLNWVKLPPRKVMNANNSIWNKVNQIEQAVSADWEMVEELFCQPNLMKQKRKEGKEKEVQKKRESQEINLLDSRRSLNVNIFLKQFRTTNDEIIRLIANGKSNEIGAEKLKSLLKILPENDEIEMLRSFDGDSNKLGQAEKFFISLVDIPHYRLRVEGMLLREEFTANMDYLMPSIESITEASKELLKSASLKDILHLVLSTGNFLNAGGYAGNAVGFKMSSLLKLVETRANKPRMNLLHFVAQLAEQKNPELMTFPTELTHLEEASRFAIDQLLADVKALHEKVDNVHEQVEAVTDDYKDQMQGFLQAAKEDLGDINRMLDYVEKLRIDLAEYFCEDASTFKLEECIVTFKIFCEKFKKAIAENETRTVQEKRARERQKQRADQKAASLRRKETLKKAPVRSASAPTGREANSIVDRLLGNIRDGFTGKYQGVDTDGTTTDSDYGSRPTSPVPSGDGKNSAEETSPAFVRSTAARRSFQKQPNLNAISENSQSREAVDVTRRHSRSGPLNESKSDDPLLNLLLSGNEEEAMNQFQSFKREGSVRRSGRKRRTTQYNMTDSRERSESPSSFSHDHEPSVQASRPRSIEIDNSEEQKNDQLEDGLVPRSPLRRSYRMRQSLDSPENLLAVNSLSRREKIKDFLNEDKITSPTEQRDQPVYQNSRSQNGTSRPISFGSDDGSISSEVADALSDRSENTTICDDIHRERIAMYANQRNMGRSVDPDRRLSGDSPSFHPISGDSTDSKRNSRADSEISEASDQLNVGTVANHIDALTSKLDSFEKDKNSNNNERASENATEGKATSKSEDLNVKDADSTPADNRLSDWKTQVQSMNIEAAVNAVESSVYDRTQKPNAKTATETDSVQPLERRESAYRARLREWRSMRSDSVSREPSEAPKQLTDHRRENPSYVDAKSTEVFKESTLTPHLALAAMTTETFEEKYRDKITRDRQVLESIMMGQAAEVPEETKESAVPEKTEPTAVAARPVGLKALKLKHKTVEKGSDSDEDPWSTIDRQQIEIRRDIFDIKQEHHRRSQSDTESTPASSPVKEFKEFIAPGSSVFDEDVIVEDLEVKQDINQNITKSPESPPVSEEKAGGSDVIYQLSGTDTYVLKNDGPAVPTTEPTTDSTTTRTDDSKIVKPEEPKTDAVKKVTKSSTPSKSVTKSPSTAKSAAEKKSVNNVGVKAGIGAKKTTSTISGRTTTTNGNVGKSSPSPRIGTTRSPATSKNATPSPKSSTSSRSSTPNTRNGTPTSTRSVVSASPKISKTGKANGIAKASSRAGSIDSLQSIGSERSDKERCDSSASVSSSVSTVSQSRRANIVEKSVITTGRSGITKAAASKSHAGSSMTSRSSASPRVAPGAAKRVAAAKATPVSTSQTGKTFVRGAPLRTTLASSVVRNKQPNLTASTAAARSSLRVPPTSKSPAPSKSPPVSKSPAPSTKSSSSSSSTSSPRSTTKDPMAKSSNFSRAGSVRRSVGPKSSVKKNYTPAYSTLSARKSASDSKKSVGNKTGAAASASTPSNAMKKQTEVAQTKNAVKSKDVSEDDIVLEVGVETQQKIATSAVEALNAKIALRSNDVESDHAIVTASDDISDLSIQGKSLTRSNSDPDIIRSAESTPDVTLREKSSTFQRNGPNRYSLPPASSNISRSPDSKKSGKPGKFSRIMNRLSLSGSKKSDKLEPNILEASMEKACEDVFSSPSSLSPSSGTSKTKSKTKSSTTASKDRLSRNKSSSFRVSSKSSKASTTSTAGSAKDSETPKRRLWRSASVKSKDKASAAKGAKR